MPEHAIAIARVSQGAQREEDQVPGLTAYAVDRKGYILDAVIPIHGKSAFHGRQVKHVLAAIDEHVRRGAATVVIFRHVDRSSRQGAFEGYGLIRQIMEAGARVEFSEQEFLNNQPGILGIFFEMAKAESEIKRDRKLQGIRVRSDAGKLNGKPPWGYASDNGVLTPNSLGSEWVPKIYRGVINGQSIRSLVAELKAHAVPSPQQNGVWNDSTVLRMIQNPTYKGDRVGKGEMEYVPLVPSDVWSQANEIVCRGYRRGRSTVTNIKALITPWCGDCYGRKRQGCPTGQSPMYRSASGGRAYYRCYGVGPERSTCGARLIPMAELDTLVERFICLDVTPHMITIYHPAEDNGETIKDISKRIRQADAAGDDDLMETLVSERKGLRLLGTLKPAWKEEKPSGLTRAQYYATLDLEGRRELLALVPWRARKLNGVTAFCVAEDYWIDAGML